MSISCGLKNSYSEEECSTNFPLNIFNRKTDQPDLLEAAPRTYRMQGHPGGTKVGDTGCFGAPTGSPLRSEAFISQLLVVLVADGLQLKNADSPRLQTREWSHGGHKSQDSLTSEQGSSAGPSQL